MALNKLKVCLIGAGPSGMSVMYHLNKLAVAGKQIPQIKCYEKQSACGGLWNYSWRTGKLFVLFQNNKIQLQLKILITMGKRIVI